MKYNFNEDNKKGKAAECLLAKCAKIKGHKVSFTNWQNQTGDLFINDVKYEVKFANDNGLETFFAEVYKDREGSGNGKLAQHMDPNSSKYIVYYSKTDETFYLYKTEIFSAQLNKLYNVKNAKLTRAGNMDKKGTGKDTFGYLFSKTSELYGYVGKIECDGSFGTWEGWYNKILEGSI
jgi:hypothetical protein